MKKRLSYLGPEGTYTEEAATKYDPDAFLVSCTTITAAANAAEAGEADEAVLPIENSHRTCLRTDRSDQWRQCDSRRYHHSREHGCALATANRSNRSAACASRDHRDSGTGVFSSGGHASASTSGRSASIDCYACAHGAWAHCDTRADCHA